MAGYWRQHHIIMLINDFADHCRILRCSFFKWPWQQMPNNECTRLEVTLPTHLEFTLPSVVGSPRPVAYQWTCPNDAILGQELIQVRAFQRPLIPPCTAYPSGCYSHHSLHCFRVAVPCLCECNAKVPWFAATSQGLVGPRQ